MPFVYKGWRLYKREVRLKRGPKVTIYFFSKRKPGIGEPTDLPRGRVVAENKLTGLPFLRVKDADFYPQRVDEARLPAYAPPDRAFLVRSYRPKFDRLQRTLKECIGSDYRIVTGKDVPTGNFLASMCRTMRSCVFGVVVLGGLKAPSRKGSTRGIKAKYNMCFEYGLLVGMRIPVLLLLVGDEHLDLKVEFSDVDGEVYHKVKLRSGRPLGRQVKEVLGRFLVDLPRLQKERWKAVLEDLPPTDRQLAMAALRALVQGQDFGRRAE